MSKASGEANQGVFSFSVLIDNAESTLLQERYKEVFEGIPYFIKIDCGYNRAGVLPATTQYESLLGVIATRKDLHCRGLYTHFGSSYNADSPAEAIEGLFTEIKPLEELAKQIKAVLPNSSSSSCKILSVGATPTATAAQNFLGEAGNAEFMAASAKEFRELKQRLDGLDLELELHAGCYPVLDIQQIATHARPAGSGLSHADIGLRIAADVVGRYHRNGKHEALVSAGSLALGREPCKSYPGWGVVAPKEQSGAFYDDEKKTGWIVGRISQEHGILTWEGDEKSLAERDLKIGDRVLIWPNHACIAGAMFDEYAIVDSDRDASVISEVWPRCRGW
jgi:D-serine deaminase-like pyridoxal phosphate-dependent protein